MRLRDYQVTAITQLVAELKKSDVVTLQLPPGTGKTVVASSFINKTIPAQGRVIYIVPTKGLVEQTMRVLHQTQSMPVYHVSSLPHGLSGEQLESVTGVIVTTYISVVKCFDAHYDLAIYDEAHHTVGEDTRLWSQSISDKLRADKRVFLTATPKIVEVLEPHSGDMALPVKVSSMDDTRVYGEIRCPLTMREAICQGFLSPYRICVLACNPDTYHLYHRYVGDSVLSDLGRFLTREQIHRYISIAISLINHIRSHPGEITTCLAFANSIDHSKAFTSIINDISDHVGLECPIISTHVDGYTPNDVRADALQLFQNPPQNAVFILSNVRIFSEGIDIPECEAVIFVDSKSSSGEITQIIGRSLRLNPKKKNKFSTILLPVIIPENETSFEEAILDTNYGELYQVLESLRTQDEGFKTRSLLPRGQEGTSTRILENPSIIWDASIPDHLINTIYLKAVEGCTNLGARIISETVAFYSRYRHTKIPRNYTTETGFPLGGYIQKTHQRYINHELPESIAYHLSQIPGWEWKENKRKAPLSFPVWQKIVEDYVNSTHTKLYTRVATWNNHPIGAFYHRNYMTIRRKADPQWLNTYTIPLHKQP